MPNYPGADQASASRPHSISTTGDVGVVDSTLFARDLTTGNSVLLSGGSVVASVNIVGGIAGVALVQSDPGASSAAASAVVQVTTMDGAVRSFNVNLSPAVAGKHRFSWGAVAP